MHDCFHDFFERFEKGEFTSAISQILPAPDVCYEKLASEEPAFPFLVNYIDATAFRTLLETFLANQCLYATLMQKKQFEASYPKSLSLLKQEEQILAAILDCKQPLVNKALPPALFLLLLNEQEKKLLSQEEAQRLLSHASDISKKYLEKKIALSQGWIVFQQTKTQYTSFCTQAKPLAGLPWYPLRYFLPLPPSFLSTSHIPLLFLEPLDKGFSSILSPLKNHPAFFVFETFANFLQMLQFQEVVESLCDSHHVLYILDFYPNAQFLIQDRKELQNLSFQPILFAKRKHIEASLPILTQAIMECIAQSDEEMQSDSEAGDWLYQIAKRLLFSIQAERLGISRAASLLEQVSQEKWHDIHKAVLPKSRELEPIAKDYMEIKLAQMAQKPHVLEKRLRLVHIVPQVVDGGHAPSRLLENLILYHNPEHFELFLISSERLQFRPLVYPYNFYNSRSSQERAPKRLGLFQSMGVKIHIEQNLLTYEQSAESIASFLHFIKANVAVFHGPDIINCMCAQLIGIPVRILFEHGSQPSYPGFDLAIVSSFAAAEVYQELYAKLKTDVRVLPFQVDVRNEWQPKPFPKEQWGLPENSMAMTTISNHLHNRLGNEMRLAIVEILKRVPKAYYTPMGLITDANKEKFQRFFQKHGVSNRVIFLGAITDPSQCARSMQLYLNEFPFGSGLGILDAMAAGCPVITMYDLQGPQQARYGGEYFGIDRAVTSCKREDYVELACQLLNNSEMYREWSEHAKKQYEKRADVATYVKAFETIVQEAAARN